MDKKIITFQEAFLRTLGITEEPFGVYYTNQEPQNALTPRSRNLPDPEKEREGEINWGAMFEDFTCVLGLLWRARKKKVPAYFSKKNFGCFGGAFYLGFLNRPFSFVAYFVSTGIPNCLEGERYLESPEVTQNFFKTIAPRPAPATFCVFKPISQFSDEAEPELVIFFARPESICGLHQLATFITNDFEAVCSPFGPGCGSILTWPLHLISQGKFKAVLGGWDPSERTYLKTDELTFTVPLEMYKLMLSRWQESFLVTKTWRSIQKKIEKSKKAWGETIPTQFAE
ncbi:MAG: DUF169 domain-containing protein [Desulfobacterota bacterium]|nr:DUF169 domain-containing protein [Thermodesulfobacteriota bacterium]